MLSLIIKFKNITMKNVVKFSLITSVFLLISCNKEKTINDELKEAAASMNKLTPQILNDGVRLDSVLAQGDKIFKYNYTLTEDVKENVTPDQIEAFKNEAKQGALGVVKTSSDMEIFRENNVTLKYSYYDKNGKPTADFTITPEEYKAK